MSTYLYGLERASHDFSKSASLGKNIFTNAFPISLAQYLSIEKNLPIPLITAKLSRSGLGTQHRMVGWDSILGVNPENAYFEFEGIFRGYNDYTHGSANKSDVVVCQRKGRLTEQIRPLEIKLVVVPTSSTALKPRNQQSCEIVVRPPTVEQLAFSIAHSFGPSGRADLQEMIADELGQPNDYNWTSEKYMIQKLPNILRAACRIASEGIEIQTPLVLTAIWRSEGQKPTLEENAFDVFVWTDMAFVQLFIDATRRDLYFANGRRKKPPVNIGRPSRSLIWLVNSLWDYTTQKTLNFARTVSEITYGAQSDKAGAFSGNASLTPLSSDNFFKPRIRRQDLEEILSPPAFEHLMPERRLDQAISFQHLLNERPIIR